MGCRKCIPNGPDGPHASMRTNFSGVLKCEGAQRRRLVQSGINHKLGWAAGTCGHAGASQPRSGEMKVNIFNDLKRYLKGGIITEHQPVDFLPSGFTVRQIEETGVSVIDNFCSAEEAEYLIEAARPLLKPSRIVVNNESVKDDYRTSSTAALYGQLRKDKALIPLLYRGAMLLGVPYTHVEAVFVTHYSGGEYYKKHEDFFPGFQGDRLYTVLIYLNDMSPEQGGSTAFEKLRLLVTPKRGRAICWTNRNPDCSTHPETTHEALPVAEGSEKWVIQLWYRRYELLPPAIDLPDAPEADVTSPVAPAAELPSGVRHLSAGMGS